MDPEDYDEIRKISESDGIIENLEDLRTIFKKCDKAEIREIIREYSTKGNEQTSKNGKITNGIRHILTAARQVLNEKEGRKRTYSNGNGMGASSGHHTGRGAPPGLPPGESYGSARRGQTPANTGRFRRDEGRNFPKPYVFDGEYIEPEGALPRGKGQNELPRGKRQYELPQGNEEQPEEDEPGRRIPLPRGRFRGRDHLDGGTYTMAGYLKNPEEKDPPPRRVNRPELPPGNGQQPETPDEPRTPEEDEPRRRRRWGWPDWLRWPRTPGRPRSFSRPGRVQYGFILILAALILHALKYVMQFDYSVLWMLDVAFAFIVFYVIFSQDERETKGIRGILVILLLETLFPITLQYLQSNFEIIAQNQFVYYYLANRLLTPWWLYYAIIRANDCDYPNFGSKIAKILLFMFWLGVLFSIPAVSIDRIDTRELITPQQNELLRDFTDRFVDFWWHGVVNTVWESIINLFSSLWGSFQEGLHVATGGYYTGMVDRHENQRLGVYFDEVEPTARVFNYESPVSVYGIIDILSLNDGIKLDLRCHQDGRDACEVYPDEPQWYYRHQREQLDCKFSERRLRPGHHDITLEARFNFETMAYQRTYFMDYETKRSLIAEGKDPLGEYDITDTDPEAIYTAGPVMIGMEIIAGQPVEIEPGSNRRPSFGVTIDRNHGWQGYIEKLEELVIQVPESIEILVDTCTYNFIELGRGDDAIQEFVKGYRTYRSSQFRECQNQIGLRAEDFNESGYIDEQALSRQNINEEDIDNRKENMENCLVEHAEREIEGQRTYVLDVDSYEEEFKDIKSHKTFNCRLNIEEANEILGGSPLAIHNIRAKARYQYKLEEDVGVRVEGEVEDVPDPGSIGARALSYEYLEIAEDVVEKYNDNMELDLGEEEESLLTPCLIMGVIAQESGGQADAVGGDGERGLMQVMPNTAKETVDKLRNKGWFRDTFGDVGQEVLDNYNGFDPEHSIIVGTYYLAEKLETKDGINWGEVDSPRANAIKYSIGEYNAGAGNSKLQECQGIGEDKPAQEFSECGVDYAKGLDFLPDDHGENHVYGVWNSKEKCRERDFGPLDDERDDEDPKWGYETKEFTVSFPDEIINKYLSEYNETLEGWIDYYEEQKTVGAQEAQAMISQEELEEEFDPKIEILEKELLEKSEVKEVLNTIIKEYPKTAYEHVGEKWGEIEGDDNKELREDIFEKKKELIYDIVGKNEVVLGKNDEISESYEIELDETRYSLILDNKKSFYLEEGLFRGIDARMVYNDIITWSKIEIINETRYIPEMPFIKYDFERDGRDLTVNFKYLKGFAKTFKSFEAGDEREIELGDRDLIVSFESSQLDSSRLINYQEGTFGAVDFENHLDLRIYDDETGMEQRIGQVPWGEYNLEAREMIPLIEGRERKQDCDLLQKDMLKVSDPSGIYAREIHSEEGRYDIQLIYDPQYQARCCYSEQGPSACESEQTQGFGLGTCNETIIKDAGCELAFGRRGLECE